MSSSPSPTSAARIPISASSSPPEGREAGVERSFQTPDEPRLRVRNPSGLVSVETAETAETVVVLQALRDDDVTRTAIENAVVEQSGTTITVEIAGKSWGFLGRSPSVGVRIRCPYGSALDCTTASA